MTMMLDNWYGLLLLMMLTVDRYHLYTGLGHA